MIQFFSNFLAKLNPSATPFLNLYAKDLTAMAKAGELDPVIDREKEISRLMQILARRTKNNAILVGKSGIGKTAIAEGLAWRIARKKASSQLKKKRVLALDLPGILAGTKYRGEFEKRIKHITEEIKNNKRSIILFIDEIHAITQAGEAEGAIGADAILKPGLARGDFQAVGATTPEEYKKYIAPDKTLKRRFQIIKVRALNSRQTLEVLRGIKSKYEEYHKVIIPDKTLKAAISLSLKIKNKVLPDKAIDLIDEASAKVRLANKASRAVVREKDIKEVARNY